MANREVKATFTVDEKGFTRGAQATGKEAQKLSQILDKMGPAGKGLNAVLDKLGLSGLTAGAGIAGGITAALGVAVGFVAEAIKKYEALAEAVENYQRVTGESAEQSSREVQAFKILGVSEEDATLGAFRLTKAIAEHADKLAADGVVVQRTADGNVDYSATLAQVAQAYQQTHDPATKARILTDAFGKSGKNMIPILEANREKLKQLENTTGTVFSQADLERARQYRIDQAALAQSFNDLSTTIGETIEPALAVATEGGQIWIDTYKSLIQNIDLSDVTWTGLAQNIWATVTAVKSQDDANREARESMAQINQTIQENTALEQANEKQLTETTKAIRGQLDDQFKLDDATNRINTSQDKLNETYHKYLDDVKQFGKDSPQVRQDLADYNRALDDQKRAYLDAADAQVALAADQAKAAGAELNQQERTDLLVSALQHEADTLAPGSQLRQYIEQYIAALKSVPDDVQTTFHAVPGKPSGGKSGKSGMQVFAGGGMVEGANDEHPVMAKRGEMVLTPEQQRAIVPFIEESGSASSAPSPAAPTPSSSAAPAAGAASASSVRQEPPVVQVVTPALPSPPAPEVDVAVAPPPAEPPSSAGSETLAAAPEPAPAAPAAPAGSQALVPATAQPARMDEGAPAPTFDYAYLRQLVEELRPIEVNLTVSGVIVGTAYEVTKMLARELRTSGAFKNN